MQRQAVGIIRSEVTVSERRACGLMQMHRGTCRYRRRRVEDPRLRERLRELAAVRRRFGYRRLKVLLRRKGGRRRIPTAAARVARKLPLRSDELWTMDFAGCVRHGTTVPNAEPDGRLHALRPAHRGGHLVAGATRGAGAGRTEE